jgi:hypothetical protein
VRWCRVVVLGKDGRALGSAELSGPDLPDLEVIERLARLRLAAARRGGRIAVDQVCPELAALLGLAGLDELLGSGRQPGRQAEGWEHPLDVEEDVVTDDPPA